jgi:glycosyltransferase involved in cell wall biosynthesis
MNLATEHALHDSAEYRASRREGASAVPAVGQLLLSLDVGGGEVLAARMARRMSRRYRFVFFCLDGSGALGEALRAEGFAVHILGRRAGFDWRCARRLAGLLRDERIAIVHAHQYTPFFYAAVARSYRRNLPIVFTEHGRFFPDFRRPKRVLANRVLLARRDRVVGVGKAVRQALIDNEGLPAKRVEVVYNGIDLAPYTEAPADSRQAIRSEFAFSAADWLIVHVARLDEIKDHPLALRAFERIRARRADARLLLVGEGPQRSSIEAEIARLRLQAFVALAGTRNDVPRLLQAADLLWLTSKSEGIPLTLIEGMAAGLPVVATSVGGAAEVIDDGATGLLTVPGNAAALAESVLRLAGDDHLRRRLADASRTRAFECFSEDRMHDEYARIYEALLGARGPERVARRSELDVMMR